MNLHQNLRISLRSKNKLIYLEQPLIPLLLPAASQAACDAYDALFDTQNEMACLMLGSMSPDLQRALENYKEYDMIQELKTMFEEQAKHELRERSRRTKRRNRKGQRVRTRERLSLLILPSPRSHRQLRNIIRQRTQSATTGHRRRRKMKHGALNLYVGNEMPAAVEAIRSFDLVLPNGLVIILDNCHYAPSITRAIPCDGIYEIDMHNLYPNVSFVYNVSNKKAKRVLDSTYLWHCRLGHIKRIEKLQRYPKETMGYYFYNPHENNIFVACYAEFFENKLSLQEASGSHGLLEASRSDVGLELIQEDDTQLSNDTSKRHDEVEPNEVRPHSLEIPIRRSERISQAADRYGFYVDAKEHDMGDINEPPNYRYALSDPKSDKWLHAMNAEMQFMKDNQV
uniref:GAG-pre-integrase domain-containing protein n=1 Tax=Tanacetum cinerariifolium TaxID=118510 RepID=A0A6L2L5H1_TANCI|nr:hypothetical protein [Tanacetum cinerariifolium]